MKKSLLSFIIITFLSIALTQFSSLRLPGLVKKSVEEYQFELNKFKEIQGKRKSGEIAFSAAKASQGETYVVIIGESLNKKHMGLYGYLRDTTPLLSKMNREGELMVFNDIYSNHTHTVPVLKLALTEANQYNHKEYYRSLSIIEILKKAYIETYWLTNQVIYGAWDDMVSVIATAADNLVRLNRSIGKRVITQEYDGALISEMKKVLEMDSEKNRVIFVHLMGSHGSYASRYPKNEFSIFSGKLKQGEFGLKAAEVSDINSYDNSVVYNDFVVTSILKELQKESGVNGLIYIPDHADDVIDRLGHISAKFTYHMTQIPMVAWFSDEYKRRYPKKYHNLLRHIDSGLGHRFGH